MVFEFYGIHNNFSWKRRGGGGVFEHLVELFNN